MAKAKCEVPEDRLELYEKLVATNPEVKRKGAANPYTSCNGHMFSFMSKQGELALRMSAEDREAFIKKFKTQLAVAYNTVMKEYVVVPDDLLQRTRTLKKYFDMSYAYVSSLEPKPTTRKKAAKKKTAKKASKKKAAAKKSSKKKVGKKKASKKKASKRKTVRKAR